MRLKDKAVMLAAVVISVVAGGSSMAAIAAALAALTISLVSEFSERRKLVLYADTAYILLSFFLPVLCAGLPLIVCDTVREKSKPLTAAAAAAAVFSARSSGAVTAALITALCLFSAYTSQKSSKLEQTEDLLRRTRDDSRELTELLQSNNRSLIKLKDSEVYNATLRERNRIAREIHDNVGHILTRCLLQMGALIVVTKDEAQKEQLKSVQQSLDSAMTSIRESVHDLHDDSIDLRQKVDEILSGAKDRFRVSLDYDVSHGVSADIKLAFIGILKEAVSNAVKHSNGDRLNVSVQEYPQFCRIKIHDNGVMPENSNVESTSGIGLANMRERIAALGGSITIESSATGFRIFASAPKRENTEEDQ